MKNEQEANFGRTLLALVAHLIKNAQKIPAPVIEVARAVEDFTWENRDAAAKRTLVRQIAESTEAPSAIQRHFEAYPHQFSKDVFARYLSALKSYKESLGL